METETLAPMEVQAPQAGEPHVSVFRTLDEIEQVRDLWTGLQNHPNSDIDFYRLMHQSRPEGRQPYIAVLYRGPVPEAMLVGRIEDSEIEMRLGYARLLAPKIRILNFVYAGGLGNLSEENSARLLQEVNASLARGEAGAAVFRFLRTDSPLYRLAATSPTTLRRDHCLAPQLHRGMELPHGVEALRSRFSAKVRKNHKWQAGKLMKDHADDVRVRTFRAPSDLDELFRDAETVARMTYQRGLGVGFEDSPAMRERLGFEAGRGTLLAYVLYVAGAPAAFWIGTAYKKTFFSSFMGYDPGLAKYSPGTFLLMKVVEGFCAGGENREVDRIDFGLGDAAYKSLLGDSEWSEATVYIFAPSFRARALNLLRTPLMRLDASLKATLEKTDVLGRVKRFWRQRVRKDAGPRSE